MRARLLQRTHSALLRKCKGKHLKSLFNAQPQAPASSRALGEAVTALRLLAAYKLQYLSEHDERRLGKQSGRQNDVEFGLKRI